MSKQILEDVLGKSLMKGLWTSACSLALPVIPQDFALSAVLAPVLYMLRWNRRRGQGNFVLEFGSPQARLGRDKAARVKTVAEKLLEKDEYSFAGNEDSTTKVILADLLLAYCFENKGHSEERDAPIQRVYPTHYFSSWIDLPDQIAHLRGVPEFIVSTLRSSTHNIDGETDGFVNELKQNPLMVALGDGFSIDGDPNNRESDRFNEEAKVGIDQLITIRVAQRLGVAPNPQRSSGVPQVKIPAERAHWEWYEDMNIFLRAYGHTVPRLTLIPMLESCLAVGLTSVFLSTIAVMRSWEHDGEVPQKDAQSHWPVLIDCSAGTDRELRMLAEESVNNLMRQIQQLSIQFATANVLSMQASLMRVPGFTRQDRPNHNPTDSLNTLGALLHKGHSESQRLWNSLDEKCIQIAERLVESDNDFLVSMLENSQRHPAWRLSECIVSMMGNKLQYDQLRKFFDSCAMVNEPNGLAIRRKAVQQGKSVDRRYMTLSNAALDYLVHRHIRQGKTGTPLRVLSVRDFIAILRSRYGFYITDVPMGLDVPAQVLHRNKLYLERRLRDLGLLVGVNDAEAMKRLRPRFDIPMEQIDGDVGTAQTESED